MLREGAHPLGLKALAAVHVPGQAAENMVGFVLAAQLQHPGDVVLHALAPDGLHALCGQIQRVGHGHANAALAHVEAQYAHAHTTLMQN